jgi:hypothetical protein
LIVKKVAFLLVCLAVLTLSGTSSAQNITNTATFTGTSRSLYLYNVGAGSLPYFFTTYDGANNVVPRNDAGTFSGEVRPRAGEPGIYETDYITFSGGFITSYGTFVFGLPTTDSDNNGLPDITQFNKAVSTNFNANHFQDYPNVLAVGASGAFSRAANTNVGTFVINSPANSLTITGLWRLTTLVGPATYIRGNTNHISFNITNSLGTHFTGSTPFSLGGANQLSLPQFDLTAPGNQIYTVLGAPALTRNANKYGGTASFFDFQLGTSWADFVSWHFEISDPNDTDGNGIPDLSDAAPVVPSILTQPQSKTIQPGSNVTFSVIAAGTGPLKYQWRKNGTNIASATGPSFVINPAQVSHSGDYSVLVTNKFGTITSSNAVLSVITPPVITSQPANITAAVGSNANFTIGVSGGAPFNFQWRYNDTNILDATNSSLLLTNLQTTSAGAYRVVVTNFVGSVTSQVGTLTVVFPPSIITPPTNQVVNAGSTAMFFVEVGGTAPFTYQWQYLGANIAGATINPYSLANAQPNKAGQYRVIVANAGGSVTSSVAALTVNGPPAITLQPHSLTNLAGTSASFTVAAGGTEPLIYQWRLNGNPLPGETAPTIQLPDVQTANAGNYTALVTNTAGSVVSSIATLTVWYPPAITAQPQSRIVPVTTPAKLTVAATGTAPLSYQWRFFGTNLPGATTTSFSIASMQPTNAGDYTVLITNIAGSLLSQPATLILGSPTNTVGCIPPPTNMVSWWTADGNAMDLHGTNHGTLINGATYAPGKVGQAFTLNGTTAYIQVPHSPSLNITGQISILTWVNPTSSNLTTRIVDKHSNGGSDGYHFGIVTNRLQMKVGTTIINGKSNIPTNAFIFLAGTYDGTALKLYNNGVLDTNLATVVTIPTNALNLRMGVDLAGSSPFKGLIDEVMLFNRALTAAEIQAIYATGPSGLCEGVAFSSITKAPGSPILIKGGGRTGSIVRIDSTFDLINWIELITLTNSTGTFQFTDPSTSMNDLQFYRAVIP